MTSSLKGKVAVVTGGAKGIGLATAHLLREQNAVVVILDTDGNAGVPSADRIGASFIRADVSDGAAVQSAIDQAIVENGGVDILVNNAGTMPVPALTVDISETEWDRSLQLNLKSAWLCSKATIPSMIARGGGTIVNMSSTAGLVGFEGLAAYGSAKAALLGLTRVMAVEYASHGIRVNAVCPGHTRTPMGDYYIGLQRDPVGFVAEFINKGHPLGHMAEAEEIARVICFLVSPDSSFMTGTAVTVDGGYTAK